MVEGHYDRVIVPKRSTKGLYFKSKIVGLNCPSLLFTLHPPPLHRVFFKKMQGDYHRYHVEATMDPKHKQAALQAYTDALETAKSNLPVCISFFFFFLNVVD